MYFSGNRAFSQYISASDLKHASMCGICQLGCNMWLVVSSWSEVNLVNSLMPVMHY